MDKVGGSALKPNASGVMPQIPDSGDTPPFACAAFMISRMMPFSIVT